VLLSKKHETTLSIREKAKESIPEKKISRAEAQEIKKAD
jgi:hypothetical protein